MEKRVEQEAFVYLWYDASNKKYYLGKHKGTPDDGYTHSSSIWESFTKDTIPEGVSRRILAYGTHEEMCILEHELLVDRKKRCWDRYYNESLGDPRYVDTSGENHPQWKGGISYNYNEYHREYKKTSRELNDEYAQREKKRKLDNVHRWPSTQKRLEGRKKRQAERQGTSTLDRFM